MCIYLVYEGTMYINKCIYTHFTSFPSLLLFLITTWLTESHAPPLSCFLTYHLNNDHFSIINSSSLNFPLHHQQLTQLSLAFPSTHRVMWSMGTSASAVDMLCRPNRVLVLFSMDLNRLPGMLVKTNQNHQQKQVPSSVPLTWRTVELLNFGTIDVDGVSSDRYTTHHFWYFGLSSCCSPFVTQGWHPRDQERSSLWPHFHLDIYWCVG